MKKLFALAFMALIVNSANAQLGGLLKNMATSAASSAATTVTGSSAVGDVVANLLWSLLGKSARSITNKIVPASDGGLSRAAVGDGERPSSLDVDDICGSVKRGIGACVGEGYCEFS